MTTSGNRLVVDTGLHAFGWSRERAAEFFGAHVPMPPAFLAAEIDRDTTLVETRLVLLSSAAALPVGRRLAARLSKPIKQRTLFDCLARLRHGTAIPAVAAARPAVPDRLPKLRGRVLIAEDNPVNQRVARLQVKQFGTS